MLIYVTADPQLIVFEINKLLARFKSYGSLNFEEEHLNFYVRYGKLKTNLLVKCEKKEDSERLMKNVTVNF